MFPLIDTHCHINMMVKKEFDRLMSREEYQHAQAIIADAASAQVTTIINVGTSLIESRNCIELAQRYASIYAAIAIHPNDLTDHWQKDIKELSELLKAALPGRIVAIGECGIDKHYPDFNLSRQEAAFHAQIERASEHDLPILVHSRDAAPETFNVLQQHPGIKGIIHCFSEDLTWAQKYIELGFFLGIGGTVTYPKNEKLRIVVKEVPLEKLVLETDAPFLPLQNMRGQQNHPRFIRDIAQHVADLKAVSLEEVAKSTTTTAKNLLHLKI